MPYVYKEVTTAGAIFCYKHYSARYGKRASRGANTTPTTDQQRAVNKRLATQRRLWTICDYFKKNDYFITLTYRRSERPESIEEAMKEFSRCFAKVGRVLKKRDIKLTYMHMCERGTHGAVHHHVLIKNTFEPSLIINAWTRGSVNVQKVYSSDMLKLGMYFLKGNSQNSEKRFSQSRNIIAPKPKVRIIKAERWTDKPRPRNGYDVANITDGTDLEYGFQYQEYIMVKRE